MAQPMFVTPPNWVSQPETLDNVLYNQSFGAVNPSTFTSLEDGTLLEQGIKQFQYWRKELQPSIIQNTIIMSFLGPKGLEAGNIPDVLKALSNVCSLSGCLEIYRAANSKFFGLSFSEASEITKIISGFKFFRGLAVVHITSPSANTHNFRLLWLPPLFPVDKVHSLLKKYTSHYHLKRESMKTSDHSYTPTNNFNGTLSPPEGIPLSSLPHLVRLPSPHRGCALLTIDGRSPLCLKCRQVGHLRKVCNYTKCGSCLQLHSPERDCGTDTYASMAHRNVFKSCKNDWLDNTDDEQLAVGVAHYISSPQHRDTLPDTDIISKHSINPISTYDSDSHAPTLSVQNSITTTNDNTPTIISDVSSSKCDSSPLECNRTFINSTPTLSVPHNKSDFPVDTLISNTSNNYYNPSTSTSASYIDSDMDTNDSSSGLHRAHKRRQASSLSPRKKNVVETDIAFSIDSLLAKRKTPSLQNTKSASPDPSHPSLAQRSEFIEYDTVSPVSNTKAHTLSPATLPELEKQTSNISNTTIKHTENIYLDVPSTNSEENTPVELLSGLPSDHFNEPQNNLGYSDREIAVIRSVCPNRKITAVTIKKLSLLKENGYSIEDIMKFPTILKTSETNLKKKLKAIIRIDCDKASLAELYFSPYKSSLT